MDIFFDSIGQVFIAAIIVVAVFFALSKVGGVDISPVIKQVLGGLGA